MRPPSPYLAPGFYDKALAEGRHRAIVGGRWDETGRLQMQALQAAGLERHHRLLDIGAGALRLGCRAVPYLDPGNYWATDASLALMQRGYEQELAAKDRLPPTQLIEDAAFTFPGVPAGIDFAIAFAVFTHLPEADLSGALSRARAAFPALRAFLFTVFLCPPGHKGAFRQADGVVTHPDRPPWHLPQERVEAIAREAGFHTDFPGGMLPRGQALCVARPA